MSDLSDDRKTEIEYKTRLSTKRVGLLWLSRVEARTFNQDVWCLDIKCPTHQTASALGSKRGVRRWRQPQALKESCPDQMEITNVSTATRSCECV